MLRSEDDKFLTETGPGTGFVGRPRIASAE